MARPLRGTLEGVHVGFSEWLESHHYSPSTARKAVSDLGRAEQAHARGDGFPADRNVQLTLRRYLTYAREHRFHDPLTEAIEADGFEPLTRHHGAPKPRRKLEARSFRAEDWNRLTHRLQNAADPAEQVLWAMTRTGLRVGDVLRVSEKQLARGLRSGELELVRKGSNTTPLALAIPGPWKALHYGMLDYDQPNVAAYVSGGDENAEADGAAYHRVNRALKRVGASLGLEGRLNTHRLRRTYAIHALEATEDTIAVQQALGHRSMQSTMAYVDEANVRKMGRLQRRLAGLPPEDTA